jgi:hypothetical protein
MSFPRSRPCLPQNTTLIAVFDGGITNLIITDLCTGTGFRAENSSFLRFRYAQLRNDK